MVTLRAFAASTMILGFSVTQVFADCSGIANGLPDGSWLFRSKAGWRPVSELSSAISGGGARTLTFAYVVNEPAAKNLRRGLVVIKTGLNGTAARTGGGVRLARGTYDLVDQCETSPGRLSGTVSGKSYDNYHDYSYSVDEQDEKTIKAFHVSYAARVRGCKRSDDDTSDSYFGRRWQSNRSQFSFNPAVVSAGQYSQVLGRLRVSVAYAETASERTVRIWRYAADATGRACIRFQALVRPGSFVRVNDLERRVGLFRVPELVWNWSRAQ